MRCPICGEELVEGMGRRYETLEEHVFDPNGTPSLKPTLVCDNQHFKYTKDGDEGNCPFRHSIFWDYYIGDFYVLNGFGDTIREHEDFLKEIAHNHMFEARDSHARKVQIDIYKKKRIELFRLFRWRWVIDFKFTGDEDGNIVKRRPYIQMFSTDDDGNSWSYTTTFITSFLHSVHMFKNTLKRYQQHPTNKYVQDEIEREFEPLPKWDTRFYRRLYKWYINTFYKNIKNRLKAKELLKI